MQSVRVSAPAQSSPQPSRQQLADLQSLIHERELGARPSASRFFPADWQGPQDGLVPGMLHEWFDASNKPTPFWSPPLLIFTHLIRQSLGLFPSLRTSNLKAPGRHIMWIGRHLWPMPHILLADREPKINWQGDIEVGDRSDRRLLERSFFIDPPDRASRLWAIDLALRCPSVNAVVADGSGFEIAQTRRLQLAAEAGNTLALLARPGWEMKKLSAATTRWQVTFGHQPSAIGSNDIPQMSNALGGCPMSSPFTITLLRCKGLQFSHSATDSATTQHHHRHWILEWNHAKSCLHPPADVADRSHQKKSSCSENFFRALREVG